MAVNRASNSRFMGWDGSTAARPDIRRLSGISNFTATFQSYPVLVSRFQIATSTIIERIRDAGYELWKATSGFRDAISGGYGARHVSAECINSAAVKRVRVLSMLEGVGGFCGWRVSGVKWR